MAAITVKMTPTMGRGVFATGSMPRGFVLATFHTIRLPPHEVRAMAGGTLSHFWFEDDADGAAFVVLGWLEMVNHATAPNLDRTWHVTPEGEVVTLFCVRDIASGEQLFIDYRFTPGSANPAWAHDTNPHNG